MIYLGHCPLPQHHVPKERIFKQVILLCTQERIKSKRSKREANKSNQNGAHPLFVYCDVITSRCLPA